MNISKIFMNEDGYYSNALNHEDHIKYPSIDLAMSFSQEEFIDKNIKPFGLHGAPGKISYKYWVLNEKI
jgi:hypothetical protein